MMKATISAIGALLLLAGNAHADLASDLQRAYVATTKAKPNGFSGYSATCINTPAVTRVGLVDVYSRQCLPDMMSAQNVRSAIGTLGWFVLASTSSADIIQVPRGAGDAYSLLLIAHKDSYGNVPEITIINGNVR